jgi:hypothetical protein
MPPSALSGDKVEEHILERGVAAAGLEAKLVERAFRQELAGLDDADAVDQPLGNVEHMVVRITVAPARVIEQDILDRARWRRRGRSAARRE